MSDNLDPEVGRCGYAQFEPVGNGPITPEQALEGINKIRNSIVGLQTINWSEHIYPLVSLLNRAGVRGMDYPEAKANFRTCLEQRNEAVALLVEHLRPGDWRSYRHRVKAFLTRAGAEIPDDPPAWRDETGAALFRASALAVENEHLREAVDGLLRVVRGEVSDSDAQTDIAFAERLASSRED